MSTHEQKRSKSVQQLMNNTKNTVDKKKLFLIFLLLSAVALLVLFVVTNREMQPLLHPSPIQKRTQFADHTITLTKDGFTPQEIRIKQGQSIKFITTTNEPFWPASDLHPTHELYPAFDPKEPIPADKSYVFRFTKLGRWKFHDHLAPFFTGTISVEKYRQDKIIYPLTIL